MRPELCQFQTYVLVPESSVCGTLGTTIGNEQINPIITPKFQLLYPGYYIQNSPVGSLLCFQPLSVKLTATATSADRAWEWGKAEKRTHRRVLYVVAAVFLGCICRQIPTLCPHCTAHDTCCPICRFVGVLLLPKLPAFPESVCSLFCLHCRA